MKQEQLRDQQLHTENDYRHIEELKSVHTGSEEFGEKRQKPEEKTHDGHTHTSTKSNPLLTEDCRLKHMAAR